MVQRGYYMKMAKTDAKYLAYGVVVLIEEVMSHLVMYIGIRARMMLECDTKAFTIFGMIINSIAMARKRFCRNVDGG